SPSVTDPNAIYSSDLGTSRVELLQKWHDLLLIGNRDRHAFQVSILSQNLFKIPDLRDFIQVKHTAFDALFFKLFGEILLGKRVREWVADQSKFSHQSNNFAASRSINKTKTIPNTKAATAAPSCGSWS